MSEIDEVLGEGSALHVTPPFDKLCGRVAQIAYFVGNLDKITDAIAEIGCPSVGVDHSFVDSVNACIGIAADELARALKEYDEATK